MAAVKVGEGNGTWRASSSYETRRCGRFGRKLTTTIFRTMSHLRHSPVAWDGRQSITMPLPGVDA